MKLKLNWRAKIIILIIVIIVGSFLFQILYLFPFIQNRVLEFRKQQQARNAEFIAFEIENVLSRMEGRIRGLLNLQCFQDFNIDDISRTLSINTTATPLIQYLVVFEPEGNIVAGTVDRFPHNEYVYGDSRFYVEPIQTGGIFLTTPFCYDRSGSIIVSVSVPFESSATSEKGVIVAGISLVDIERYIQKVNSDPESVIVVLDGRDKAFIHSKIDICGDGGPIDYSTHPMVIEDKESGKSCYFTDAGDRYLGTSRELPRVRWKIGIFAPLSYILEKNLVLRTRLIAFNSVFFFLVLVFALLITRKITMDQRRMEALLRRSEERFRSFVENANDIVFELGKDGTVCYVSLHWPGLLGSNFFQLLHEDDRDKMAGFFTTVLQEKTKYRDVEYRIRRNDGEYRWHSINGSPIADKNGEVISVIGISRDITSRKEQEERLMLLLREKDYLMQEIHHRVKNNLAMIISLLNLKESESTEIIDLSDVKGQVEAIRIVHEKLYKSEDIARIDVREYMDDLLATVFSFSTKHVRVENTIQKCTFSAKTVISMGLIVNEVASNAMKHGFTGQEMVFSITLENGPEDGWYTLVLSNNGVPIPEGVVPDNPETLGLRLISALVEQLGGTIDIKREPHPEFTIRFPAE